MQRIPWWHGRPVGELPGKGSLLAWVIACTALVFVAIGVAIALVGGTPDVLGVAMLVLVVALPAAASIQRRRRRPVR